MAKTIHSSFEQHLGNEAAAWANICTKVNTRKWHLSAGAGMHRVEVVDKAFHGLKRLLFDIFISIFYDSFWELEFFDGFFVTVVQILWNFDLELFTGEVLVFLNIIAETLAEGLVDTWSKRKVEVRNRLTTVLFVLVSLEDNRTKCSSRADALWRTEEAMTGIKTVFEKFEWISLAAGKCTGRKEI